ncbi:MAG: GntR family transcriptional regulator [Anaerolineaceae bacterium]|jgi:GntR family transcriptional regulator|nr:GntR family transcriptional regulator [Anaerolineaceae bacterium]
MEVLDRSSYTPLYQQIGEALRLRIEKGELIPGDRIPSENELIDQYHVSRNTVRLAISSLIVDGLVYRVKGRGTYVAAERMSYGLIHMSSFSEEMRNRGLVPGSQVLSFGREMPSKRMRQILKLEQDQMVYRVERLRLADGEPMALNLSFIPVFLCPDLEHENLASGSLYALLENQYRYCLGYAEYVIKTTSADERQSKLLGVLVDDTLLIREGTTYLENGVPIEHTILYNRGDRYQFTFRAIRRPTV